MKRRVVDSKWNDRKSENKEEYVINFNAGVDVKIEENSPEEAKRKAREMFGEYYDKQFAYVYLLN